jgi:hypothetical protein
MATKETLATAINQVLNSIRKEKEAERIDMELFANNCIREFQRLDLPFYSIAINTKDKNRISIEAPFLVNCHIQVEQYLFGSKEKAALLYINGRSVRKIRLEDNNPEYMARIAHALLDYLKRYIILKNKFDSK